MKFCLTLGLVIVTSCRIIGDEWGNARKDRLPLLRLKRKEPTDD